MKQKMNEVFKKSSDIMSDILSQQRFPCDKSRIGYCISQKPESKTLKLSQEEEEEKATNYDHGDGSNERKYHIQQKKIWKKDNPKEIYTHGELKEGQEENKGTIKQF